MSLISVCVPSKRNNRTRSDHEDHHYMMAQVSYLYEEECICIPADDKNKIYVGLLAVSRYFQLRHFFPTTDSPDFLDHDFPYPGTKVSPSGYLILSTKPSKSKHRSRSLSPDRCRHRKNTCLQCLSPARQEDGNALTKDKFGRLHVRYEHTSPLYVFNRTGKFHSSSVMGHANDLYTLLSSQDVMKGRKALLLLTDNSTDWSPKSLKTFLYLGRLWRQLDLDVLVQTTHAAAHSQFNNIPGHHYP